MNKYDHQNQEDQELACRLAYEKVERCIASSLTHEQLKSCERMIEAFEILFEGDWNVTDNAKNLRKLLAVKLNEWK